MPKTMTPAAKIKLSAQHLWALTFGDGIQPPIETPNTTLFSEPHRTLRRFGTEQQCRDAAQAGRTPVLLITPHAVSGICYDLSPERSLVKFLLDTGRIPYLLDYGKISRADRHLGFENFIKDIVPQAIQRSIADYSHYAKTNIHSDDNHNIHLAGWSLAGTVCFLTMAANPDLPVTSISALGTPLNYGLVPPYPLLRRLSLKNEGRVVTKILKITGGIPAKAVQLGYRATALDRELKRPKFILQNLTNAAALARMEITDRFQKSFPGYPGLLSEQMWESFIFRDEVASGVITLNNQTYDIRTLTTPIQLFGSHSDAIVPWAAAEHGLSLFTNSRLLTFTTVETSHLGLISGPMASKISWPQIDSFITEAEASQKFLATGQTL